MSDIIDSLKQGANQILSNIDQDGRVKSAIEGIRHQFSEVERRRRIGQLENLLRNLQLEIKQLTEALGLQTLSLYDTGAIKHPELARLCERINELRSDADEARAELAQFKAQMAAPTAVKCPQCQAQVAANTEFCPQCGARLKTQMPPQPATTPASSTQQQVRFRCPKCKTVLPASAGFCPSCGTKLRVPAAAAPTANKHFCPACGAEIGAGARFCPACGHAAESHP